MSFSRRLDVIYYFYLYIFDIFGTTFWGAILQFIFFRLQYPFSIIVKDILLFEAILSLSFQSGL